MPPDISSQQPQPRGKQQLPSLRICRSFLRTVISLTWGHRLQRMNPHAAAAAANPAHFTDKLPPNRLLLQGLASGWAGINQAAEDNVPLLLLTASIRHHLQCEQPSPSARAGCKLPSGPGHSKARGQQAEKREFEKFPAPLIAF